MTFIFALALREGDRDWVNTSINALASNVGAHPSVHADLSTFTDGGS